MKKFLALLFLCIHLFCFGQKKLTGNAIRFQSLNQAGFSQGKAHTELIVQTINGIQLPLLSVGIGVGLDYSEVRSIPFFLDVRKNLLNKPSSPFVYIDGGYHTLWMEEAAQPWITKDHKGGLYYDAGVGYRIPAFQLGDAIISLGYSGKELSALKNMYPERSSLPQEGDYKKVSYKVNRWAFKIGLAF